MRKSKSTTETRRHGEEGNNQSGTGSLEWPSKANSAAARFNSFSSRLSPCLRVSVVISTGLCLGAYLNPPMHDPQQHLERTSFQASHPYDPRIDIKTDV